MVVQGMVTVYVCILAPIEPSSRPCIGSASERLEPKMAGQTVNWFNKP